MDLEIENTPLIWLEIVTNVEKPWLAGIGYRQWRTKGKLDSDKSIAMKKQLSRFANWSDSWTRAQSEAKPLVIFGDLNIDVSPWLYPKIEKTDYQKSQGRLL